MNWHLFCTVIDNYGDAGVAWRLASLLARESQDSITLWIDKPELLDAIAPLHTRPRNIRIKPWHPDVDGGDAASAHLDPNETVDVLIELFGCRTPYQYQAEILNNCSQFIWINLEYLSAEDYVERSHSLPSPVMSGPAKGMTQWFFYPGFTDKTGGIMQADWAQQAPCPSITQPPHPNPLPQGEREQKAFIFCYENAALAPLCEAMLARGITPHIAAGRTTAYAQSHWPKTLQSRCHFQPQVPQAAFDSLLAGNALNVVRGEDSFVRAQLAARPFIWHIYPQDDGAHRQKLMAFYRLYSEGLASNLKDLLWQVWLDFNEGKPSSSTHLNELLDKLPAYTAHAAAWRSKLLTRDDLVTQLRRFVAQKQNLVSEKS